MGFVKGIHDGRECQKGQVLTLAYVTIAFFVFLAAPLVAKVMNERMLLERERLEKEVFYLAEGAVEDTVNRFMSDIANFQIQPNVPRYPAAGMITVTYVNSSLFPTGVQVSCVIDEAETGMRQILDPDNTSMGVKAYIVRVTCQHPRNHNVVITLNQAILLRVIYTFQHAVFYNDDLEIIPGPTMNFTGRIHSNKDMYLDSESTLTLHSEYVRSAGDIYNQRKDRDEESPGDVWIQDSGTEDFYRMDGLDCDSDNWLTESQERWGGTVKSSIHGVTKLATPVVGSIQPGDYYNTQANVTIENGTIRQGGVLLVEGVDIPIGTIMTDTDFYNNREGKYVRMTNIDLKKLAGYTDTDIEGSPSFTSHLPSNGLLYATRNDASVTQEPGVRLVNGSQIYRAGGLTVVSNDPIYVQGNFNTVTKKPCAVICDAVNILSNNWNDANSSRSLSYRIADVTTVNLAFIAGVDNTISGHYNGGLENYLRLHETWSGKTLTVRGSFIELWNSQIAQGTWIYGSPQYTAPNRNWDYDTDFTVNNMPPFTPWAVEAQRGARWKS